MFQMSTEEFAHWRSQFVTSKSDKMGLRRPPYVFTEHGVAMLSSVLNSDVAIEINIKIVRTFIALRQIIVAKPEYELLKEQIRRLESDGLIKDKIIDGKITQLSRKVNDLSEMFDRFQDAHIIIKRPDLGPTGE